METQRIRVERVFFVDDSADEIFITRLLFERQHIALEIEHFHNFDDYLGRVETLTKEELIASISALDLNLGVSKGTDGIAQLRAMPLGAVILVGICSGSEDPADVLSAHKVRADFFVAKPLDSKSLATICEIVPELDLVEEGDTIGVERVLGAEKD